MNSVGHEAKDLVRVRYEAARTTVRKALSALDDLETRLCLLRLDLEYTLTYMEEWSEEDGPTDG